MRNSRSVLAAMLLALPFVTASHDRAMAQPGTSSSQQGSTTAEQARSIQQLLAEIFTQMKNRKPKRSFSNKTFTEVMEESDPGTPEEQAEARKKIKLLADRLKREQEEPVVSAEKKAAIAQAVLKTSPPSRDVFEKALQQHIIAGSLLARNQIVKGRGHKSLTLGLCRTGGKEINTDKTWQADLLASLLGLGSRAFRSDWRGKKAER